MGWGKESAKNPQEVGGANAEITRGPPRGRELWRGARRVDPILLAESFSSDIFLGGIFGGIFGGEIVYLFFIFSERKINLRHYLRNKAYKYSFFGDRKINDILFTKRR